jgi:glycosyltransferase involved in cell wall biosynthesis
MPLISIVTATLHPRDDFLLQAWQSILASTPTNWDFEWCLQEDGELPTLHGNLPFDDPRIRYAANNIQAGAAATRNAAIARAKGKWILNLDSDDYYTASGLSLLTELIDTHPGCVWIAGRAHDYLDEEHRLIEFPNYLPDGRIESKQFLELWQESDLIFPYVPGGAGVRADVLRAIGGYPALPFGEDVSMLGAVAALGPGAHTTQPVFHYRRWRGQTTQQDSVKLWHRQDEEHQRIAAMKKVGLRISVD